MINQWINWLHQQSRIVKVALLGILVMIVVGVGIIIFGRESSNVMVLQQEEVVFESDNSSEELEESELELTNIYVDIKGAVAKPGVYQLPTGSRLFDVIELAGGLTENAAVNQLNQAQLLTDQMMIVVYTQDEIDSGVVEQTNNAVSDGESVTNGTASGLININQADVTQLQTLPGVGLKKAEAIIAYRQANGSFKSIDELTNVKGIGARSLESLAPLVTVE